jgi:hypothetical protein
MTALEDSIHFGAAEAVKDQRRANCDKDDWSGTGANEWQTDATTRRQASFGRSLNGCDSRGLFGVHTGRQDLAYRRVYPHSKQHAPELGRSVGRVASNAGVLRRRRQLRPTAHVHASWMDGHQFRRIRYACMIANFGSAHTLRKQPIILPLVLVVLVHVDNFDAVRSPFSIQPTRDSGLRREALPMLCDETDRVETGPLEATSDTVKCGFKSRNRYADGTGETHVASRRVGITFRHVGYGRSD